MEERLQAACEYIRLTPDAKLSTVARQFDVTRHRLRTRVQGGGGGKRGPKTPNTKLSAAEEDELCRYVETID